MESVHFFLHGSTANLPTVQQDVWGVPRTTLVLQPELAPPLAIDFESAVSQLGEFAGLYIEMDGSFVWRAADGAWQVDGVLTDDGRVVRFVELKGNAPSEMWRRLFEALEKPVGRMVIQLPQSGQYLYVEEFLTACVDREGS